MTIVDIHNITVLETQAVAMLGMKAIRISALGGYSRNPSENAAINAQSGSTGVCLMTLSHIVARSFHLDMPPEELSSRVIAKGQAGLPQGLASTDLRSAGPASASRPRPLMSIAWDPRLITSDARASGTIRVMDRP